MRPARKRAEAASALACALLTLAAGRAGAALDTREEKEEKPVESPRDGQADFDFVIGSWTVHNRRLRHPLTGFDSWNEFEATSVARKIWGGLANMDEYEGDSPSGRIRGMTLRLYDPKAHQWRLYWSNAANGRLDTPMVGEFKDGRGEFYDQETWEGRSIYVRFIWSGITPTSCHWEQAFSADGGRTWETNWTMDFTRAVTVLELRQYTLHPGARDTLVDLFDAHFVESQEALGMRVFGQFRDTGNVDRFVWIRGFEDMASRRKALEAFYTGPVWVQHRAGANATMVDSDNVLLLRPAGESAGFALDTQARPGIGAPEVPGGVVVATLHYFERPVEASFLSWFESEVHPVLARAGASVLARFVTEPAPNTFPRLPVREGENVFVWFAAYPDAEAHGAFLRRLEQLPEWATRLGPRLRSMTKGEPERLVLAPTRRSALRFRSGRS